MKFETCATCGNLFVKDSIWVSCEKCLDKAFGRFEPDFQLKAFESKATMANVGKFYDGTLGQTYVDICAMCAELIEYNPKHSICPSCYKKT